MIAPDGYTLSKCLHSTAHSEVYLGTRDDDGAEVVIKMYLRDERSDHLSRAREEFELLRRVAATGIVEAVEIQESLAKPALVLTRAPGISLAKWSGANLPEPEPFLRVAIQLASTLAHVHATRLLHCDVTPHNVLVDPTDLRTHLLDFGLARTVGSVVHGQEVTNTELAGTLAYMSPEQTGRMDRGIDFRSDLYSLGATFYCALLGRPPFVEDDALALIHAHMARRPTPPSELRAALPETLSRIVVKLLHKAPEDRYQTAGALHRDLLECAKHLASTGRIPDDMPLGSIDAPYRPLFAQRLYGRDAELATLAEAYAAACGGRPTVLLLEGDAGTGKSALADALRPDIAKANGYLALGRFDPYRRDQPFTGLIQAFEGLLQQILTESQERMSAWQQQLADSLGVIARALFDLVPDFEIFVPDAPRIPGLDPAPARERLSLAVQRLLDAAATVEHPLVLFFDDLQWADAGSRALIQDIVKSDAPRALLVILSYRVPELAAEHALQTLIRELREKKVRPFEVKLLALDEEACAQMLGAALGRSPEDTRSLAASVARKTGNSPLLIQQFVLHMYDSTLIRFDATRGWSWDDATIAATDLPDDAVGLMTAKIARLDPTIAEVFKQMSCFGETFDLDTLIDATARPREALETALLSLCDQGLIVPAREGFRFAHGRIREAAQAMLSKQERARLHHEAGRRALAQSRETAFGEHVFETADHMNHAREQLAEDEKPTVIELNVTAGKRALASGATAAASHYFGAARELGTESHWEEHAALAFDLFLSYAESCYQTREFAVALELLAWLEKRPMSTFQASLVASKQIAVKVLTQGSQASHPLVLAELRRFGVRWPSRLSLLHLLPRVLYVDWLLRDSLDQRKFRSAPPSERDRFAPMMIMASGGATLAANSYRWTMLAAAHALRVYRRHGFMSTPAFALASYATWRQFLLQDASQSERFAHAALDWTRRLPLNVPRTEYVIYVYLFSWTRPRRSLLDNIRRCEQTALEAGDLEYAHQARVQNLAFRGLLGYPLPEVLEALGALRGRAQPQEARYLSVYEQALALLARDTAATREELSHLTSEIEHLFVNSKSHRMPGWVFLLTVLCVQNRYADASRLAEQAASWAFEVSTAASQLADYVFVRGLALAELASEGTWHTRLARRWRIAHCLRKLRRFARRGPDVQHMVLCLEAELERVRGRSVAALARYGSAADRAERDGYRQHAALIHERRARVLLGLRRETESATLLRQSIACYTKWGATSKVTTLTAQLERLAWSRPLRTIERE